jgi:hypothetical protein
LRANHFSFQRAPVAQRTAGETRTDRVSAFERDAIEVVDYAGHELPLRFNVTVTNCSITRRIVTMTLPSTASNCVDNKLNVAIGVLSHGTRGPLRVICSTVPRGHAYSALQYLTETSVCLAPEPQLQAR